MKKYKIKVNIIKKCKYCGVEFRYFSGSEIRDYCRANCLFKTKVNDNPDINIRKINITELTGIKNGTRERVRELIRIRDNHTCQICGKKWIEGTRRLDVHHKDCVKEKSRQCDDYEKEKDNMITLCHKCHLNLPEHREAIIKGIKSYQHKNKTNNTNDKK